MLLIGFASVTVAHALLALSFLLPESTLRSYLILGCMLIFMIFMQTFLGRVVWVVLSEIVPMTIRGFAMGIATFALWTANTIILFGFPILAAALGSTGTFAIFVVINAIAFWFTYRFAPETRGRSLEELEDDFRSHDAAHFVHEAPAGVRGS